MPDGQLEGSSLFERIPIDAILAIAEQLDIRDLATVQFSCVVWYRILADKTCHPLWKRAFAACELVPRRSQRVTAGVNPIRLNVWAELLFCDKCTVSFFAFDSSHSHSTHTVLLRL